MLTNERADKMFFIMNESLPFNGKSVLDLGCGYGDIAVSAAVAGATEVTCIDRGEALLANVRRKASAMGVEDKIETVLMNIDDLVLDILNGRFPLPVYDICVCTSVLPYLEHPRLALAAINVVAYTAFIEMQYIGDGPGVIARNDNEMAALLYEEGGWRKVENIGATYTGRSPVPYRTIWKCK